MKKVIIGWDEFRKEIMSQPGVKGAYEAQQRLRDMLAQWGQVAGLTRYALVCGVENPRVKLY